MAQGRQGNRGLFSALVRGLWRPCEPLSRSPLSSSEPPDLSGHLTIKGGFAFIQASLLTGVHRITHVTRPITDFELRYSLAPTGGIHPVTGGVPVGSWASLSGLQPLARV